MNIKVSKIVWGDRARKDYGDTESLNGLAQSISKNGLLHPIVIDDTYTLRAGGRRLTAISILGWEEVPVTMLNDLSPLQKLEVELEENLHRKNFEFPEAVALTKKIHEIKELIAKENGEKWTTEDTAQALGVAPVTVLKDIALAKEIENDPTIANAKNKGQATTRARRSKEVRRITAEVASSQESTKEGIILGDCTDILPTIPSNSVDLVLCDPPYGVNFEEHSRNRGYDTVYGDFYDDLNSVCSLLEKTLPELYRVLKPGGHLYLFFALSNYTRINRTIELTFKDEETYGGHADNPLMWIKPSNENPRPYERFTINYEPFFFCWKPNIGSKLGNELNCPTNSTFSYNYKGVEKLHPAEKPTGIYEKLIEISSIPGATILDPFLGSGVSLAVGKEMGRKIIGIEKLEKWYNISLHNINKGDLNE
jgi:ParB/RepB/Spo0J family partition protein